MESAIPITYMRGGTSKGVYYLAKDLPTDELSRNEIILAVMGGPDPRQINGIGANHPLTNKVAIVSPSSRDDADVDYLFIQVIPFEARVDDSPNCGNILAGVGPFAIESGLVEAAGVETNVRVNMLNSNNVCELIVQTRNGVVQYEGNNSIDGVPGTAAPIICNFMDIAGSTCGSILPTGNVCDEIDGIRVTCIDNGMPVVIMAAADLGCNGAETPDEINANEKLKQQIEKIRMQAGELMNLGDVCSMSIPKMCLVSKPTLDGHISTLTLIPHICHTSIGVFGAVSVASACIFPRSVAHGLTDIPAGVEKLLSIEHPSGATQIQLTIAEDSPFESMIMRAGIIRTARKILTGYAYVPGNLLGRRK